MENDCRGAKQLRIENGQWKMTVGRSAAAPHTKRHRKKQAKNTINIFVILLISIRLYNAVLRRSNATPLQSQGRFYG